jgi:hypothetical protein
MSASEKSDPKPVRVNVPVDVWKCEDLVKRIKSVLDAHVTDLELAKKLEVALSGEVAYGSGGGGGGNVGVA